MKKTIASHVVPVLLAVIVFFTTVQFVESVMRAHGRTQAAIDWHGVEVISKVIRPGDNLEIVYSATINKQCPSDLRTFMVAPDGTVPVRLPTVAGGYAKPSDTPVEIRVKVPFPKTSDPGLAPLAGGEYIYRAMATRYCPDGVEDDNTIPDARFRLEVE